MSSNIVPKKKRTRAAPRRPEPRQDGACVSAKRGAAGAAGTRMGGGGPGAGAGAGRRTGHLLSEHRIAHRNAKSLERTRTAWWASARHPQTPAHTRHGPPVSDVSLTRTAYWALARHPANRTPPPAPTLRARGNASSYCCAAALLPLRRCCMGRVAIASRLRRLCTAGPWLRRGGVAAHVAAAVQQTKCCRQRCLGSSDGGGLCEATSTIPLISGPAHGATVRTGGVTADLRCERPSKRGRGVSNPAAHCFAKSDRGRRAGEGFERELTNVRDWIGPCFLSHSRDFSL